MTKTKSKRSRAEMQAEIDSLNEALEVLKRQTKSDNDQVLQLLEQNQESVAKLQKARDELRAAQADIVKSQRVMFYLRRIVDELIGDPEEGSASPQNWLRNLFIPIGAAAAATVAGVKGEAQ